MQAPSNSTLTADEAPISRARTEREIASPTDTIITVALMFAAVMPVLLWLKSAAA